MSFASKQDHTQNSFYSSQAESDVKARVLAQSPGVQLDGAILYGTEVTTGAVVASTAALSGSQHEATS